MKNQPRWILCPAALLAACFTVWAEPDPAFFRLAGPSTGEITQIESGGALTWTNPVLNTTCRVQIATSLSGTGNWRDYGHSLATAAVTTVRMFDLSAPVGMAFIPAGLFSMGDGADDHPSGVFGELEEDPVHTVHLDAFYIGTREVTQGEWDNVRSWALIHGYEIGCAGNGKEAAHPAGNICWHDAVRWCNAKSEMETLTPCYYTDAAQTGVYRTGTLNLTTNSVLWAASGYRLPTEAEWEYAARSGAQGARFAYGATISHSHVNYFSTNAFAYDVSPTPGLHPDYDDTEPSTCPGGALPENGYGLHEVAGNVSEWCWDHGDGVSESCGICSGSGSTVCMTCGGIGTEMCMTCGGSGMQMCMTCGGSGMEMCMMCGGSGTEMCMMCGGSGTEMCWTCMGSGTETCPGCGGAGCESCGWTGQIMCMMCGGSGMQMCMTCGGSGMEMCMMCGGSGTQSCMTCGGSGNETCWACSGIGSFTCSTCTGSGSESCDTCAGRGQLWTSDFYAASPPWNPLGPPNGTNRIIRGGGWNSNADGCRVSRRAQAAPENTSATVGFRLVRSVAD